VPLEDASNYEMQYIAIASAVFNVLFFVGFSALVGQADKAAAWLF
jgi:hypothetical protein